MSSAAQVMNQLFERNRDALGRGGAPRRSDPQLGSSACERASCGGPDAVSRPSRRSAGAISTRSSHRKASTLSAQVVGRDPGTNLLVLKSERSLTAVETSAAVARAGVLALALGSDVDGASKVRLGVVNSVGPQWFSRSGGRIEQRIGLDIRLSRTEEGGAVLDASGALLGMSTLGSRREVLVIPVATIERIVPQLLEHGEIARGWLGVALHPVAVPDALRDGAGQTSGMMVMSIVADGPAAKSGVTAGDILLTVEGASVRPVRELSAQLDGDSIGKTVQLRLIRGGEIVQVEALITARPKT